MQTTLNDWRLAASASRTDPVDPDIEAASERIMRQTLAAAPEIGSLSQSGIETLMRLTEASTALMLTHADRPLNAGSEHLFAWTLESLTGRHFLHGEIVALGIVISSWLQGRDHAALTGALDQARVTYLPERLEIEWAEIEQTLRGIEGTIVTFADTTPCMTTSAGRQSCCAPCEKSFTRRLHVERRERPQATPRMGSPFGNHLGPSMAACSRSPVILAFVPTWRL